jgi:hypothetical protein
VAFNILTPADGATISGGVIYVTSDALAEWTLNGNTITAGPFQDFNYFIPSSGSYTLVGTNQLNESDSITVSVDVNPPALQTDVLAWFVNGVYVGQGDELPPIYFPDGDYEIETRILGDTGQMLTDNTDLSISGSSVIGPRAIFIDEPADGFIGPSPINLYSTVQG